MPTPDRSEIEALIARVGALTGPDRILDGDLAHAIGWRDDRYRDGGATAMRHLRATDSAVSRAAQADEMRLPVYTGSLDAALELVQRALPGMDITLQFPGTGAAVERPTARVRFEPLSSMEEDAETMPLAVLAAGLGALLHQAEAPDER